MVYQYTPISKSLNLTAFVMSLLEANRSGEHYEAELPFDPYLTNGRMNTPDDKAWSIFDANYEKWVKQQWPTNHDVQLQGLEDGSLIKADSIAEPMESEQPKR